MCTHTHTHTNPWTNAFQLQQLLQVTEAILALAAEEIKRGPQQQGLWQQLCVGRLYLLCAQGNHLLKVARLQGILRSLQRTEKETAQVRPALLRLFLCLLRIAPPPSPTPTTIFTGRADAEQQSSKLVLTTSMAVTAT